MFFKSSLAPEALTFFSPSPHTNSPDFSFLTLWALVEARPRSLDLFLSCGFPTTIFYVWDWAVWSYVPLSPFFSFRPLGCWRFRISNIPFLKKLSFRQPLLHVQAVVPGFSNFPPSFSPFFFWSSASLGEFSLVLMAALFSTPC